MPRPLQTASIETLTLHAEKNRSNRAELELVKAELCHRTTKAAKKLREQIEIWLNADDLFANDNQSSGHTPQDKHMRNENADTASNQKSNWTHSAVAKQRSKLIDLSRRSPLIAFKHSPRSASQLRFVDERTDLLFAKLNNGSLGFEPLPDENVTPADEATPQFGLAYERARLTDEIYLSATEQLSDDQDDASAWQAAERELRARVRAAIGLPPLDYGKKPDVAAIARAHGFNTSYELKDSDDGPILDHQDDDRIRVLLTRKELERRLKSINDRATSHLRETGHHTLHLVFGFIQWYEDEHSDTISHAPLLLLPVELQKERSRAKNEYRLKSWEGGLEVNVSLIEKAREHWGLELPKLRDGETPESYFVRVKNVLKQGQRLSLRHFATLTVLPPMTLWRDLDPEAWPEGAFKDHRLLPGLLNAEEIATVDGDDTIIDIDDPKNAHRVPALITDADASQHRAIMDMAAGKDMSIEGPPGTGKSQTITNMIATALSQGKRVLFVAEKQAALRVVSDRLRAAGFGPLLLELHGDKASRADVYQGIRERLVSKPRKDTDSLLEKRAELVRHRNLLRRYLSLVRTPLGRLGKTAYELLWRQIRLKNSLNANQISALSARWNPPKADELDTATLTEHKELLTQFGAALCRVTNARAVTTAWVHANKMDPFDQQEALQAARAASNAAQQLENISAKVLELGFNFPRANQDLVSHIADQMAALQPFTCTNETFLNDVLNHRSSCEKLLDAQRRWASLCTILSDLLHNPAEVDHESLALLKAALKIESLPESINDATNTIMQLQRAAESILSAERDVERVTSQFSLHRQVPARKALQTLSALSVLSDAEPKVIALASTQLLESTSTSVIDEAIAEASRLQSEREALLANLQPDTLSSSERELEALAESIENSNAFSRLFNSNYKSAWRRASRLCNGESNREAVIERLRSTAKFLRLRDEFRDKSKAKALFPSLLWDGIDSDFSSLRVANGLVETVSTQLVDLDEFGLLQYWLSCDATERNIFLSSCKRFSLALEQSKDAGLFSAPVAQIASSADEKIEGLRVFIAAAKAVGAKSDAVLLQSDDGSIVDKIEELHRARDEFSSLSAALNFEWIPAITDPFETLRLCLKEIEALENCQGPLELLPTLAKFSAPAEGLNALIEATKTLSDTAKNWKDALAALSDKTEIKALEICSTHDWQETAALFAAMADDRSGASLIADLLKYKGDLLKLGMSPLTDAATSGAIDAEKLADTYEFLILSSLLRSYLGGDGEELGRLGTLKLDDARRLFKQVDKELHRLEAAAIINQRLAEQPPVGVGYGRISDFTELRLLEHEVELARPRTPLRDVARRAGQALQVLKPVWMMSPTSIAQFIQPGSLQFDLLIIDEASQMRPEYAISCILRADQLVVVGDANQLPPSDHFQIASATQSGEEADDEVGIDEGTESILDLANQRFRTKPRLKWHYRSQHESLIQFSNRQFYDSDLIVFPSPSANDDPLLGVKCRYVPNVFSDTAYESSINQREAQVAIEEAFSLMQTHPECSIGIVAMNAKQTELLQNEFDRLIVEDDRVRKYVESYEGTIEEFFIKNLENVQGDERDIIIISTVYGPDKNGVVRQNFGLMNREVGWRRLNVLVTRAKMSCRLITSLRPDDIKVTETSSKGVIALKAYLTYAHGGAQYDDTISADADSDFEIFVADAIRAAGYDVVYQVGVNGFRIDLGVRHESCPIGFIAGIECDGALYHSGLSVRDRDHIRQTILENLGWNIYRIWSTDWFADPARATAKLLAWLDQTKERKLRELAAQPISNPVEQQKQSHNPVEPIQQQPAVSEQGFATAEATEEISDLLPREPRGRKLRAIDGIEPYEAIRGKLYEIWRDGTLIGEVEVIKRATSAPRLFGDRAVAPQSEYEGRIFSTGDSFQSFDIYAAIKEVGVRASAQELA